MLFREGYHTCFHTQPHQRAVQHLAAIPAQGSRGKALIPKVSLRVPHSTPCSSGDRQCHPPMSHSKVGREVLPAADPAQGHSKGTKQGLEALWSW